MTDVLVVVLLALMFVSGFARGTARQIWSLGALALSTVIAGNTYRLFLGITNQFVEGEAIAHLVTFAVVFGMTSAVLNTPAEAVLGRNHSRKRPEPGFGDRMAGAVLGIVEGMGAVQVMAALLLTHPVFGWDGWILESKLIKHFLNEWPFMFSLLSSEFQGVLALF